MGQLITTTHREKNQAKQAPGEIDMETEYSTSLQ